MGSIRATSLDTSAIGRDFPIMFAFTIIMLIFALTQRKFGRLAGTLMVGGYIAYVCYLVIAAIK